MTNWVNYLVFDITGDLWFGKSFVKLVHPIAFPSFAPFWVWMRARGLDRLLAIASPRAPKKWEGYAEKPVSDCRRMEGQNTGSDQRKDFFHFLFGADELETGTGHELDELCGEPGDIKAGPKLKSCRYLYISIQEGHRMVPSAVLSGRFPP
ncbi:hypothetical protein PG993_001494 [Apiospora rasikravindrae]|uniref:Uncharacterized protein n=1 Tax=Apiospora rasikravindrae TaxID=990691 RepID=A0ABR1UBK4_9PEZI